MAVMTISTNHRLRERVGMLSTSHTYYVK